jgi:hypothetical protein
MDIKSRSSRLAGHLACIGEKRNAYWILAGKPEGNRRVGRPGVDDTIILKMELK